MPILDAAETIEGLYFTLGCSGGGLSLAPSIGKIMADFIVDGKKSADINTLRLNWFAEGKQIDWDNT
jgi:glycine/D-amino acid oxidase-like deaminating enzyme